MTGQRLGLAASVAFVTVTLAQAPVPNQGRAGAGMRGPWENDILVLRSDASGRVSPLARFPRAGVSTLARLADGRLLAAHQHFPEDRAEDFDKVAVHFSSDDGATWTAAEVIRLTGLPAGMRFPFDPTLVVLPDGRIRMYFTSLRGRRFDEDVPSIFSAISTNGIDFVVEPGQRFGIPGRPVIDCAVTLHAGVFHLFAPDNGASSAAGPLGEPRPADGIGYHATSRDGLSFTRIDDVRVEGRRRWLGAAHSDGSVMTFFGTGGGGERGRGADTDASSAPAVPQPQPRPPGGGGPWMATSRDGAAWEIVPAPMVPGADPGVVPARGGGWIWSVTGPPRGQAPPR